MPAVTLEPPSFQCPRTTEQDFTCLFQKLCRPHYVIPDNRSLRFRKTQLANAASSNFETANPNDYIYRFDDAVPRLFSVHRIAVAAKQPFIEKSHRGAFIS